MHTFIHIECPYMCTYMHRSWPPATESAVAPSASFIGWSFRYVSRLRSIYHVVLCCIEMLMLHLCLHCVV